MSESMFSKKKNNSLWSSSKPAQRKGLFDRQPFARPKDIPADQLPDLQTRWERAKTPNYVFQYLNPQPVPASAVDTGNIQRQENQEDENLQAKPLALQLQETEEKPEEDLQALPLANIQRQETPEDENLQAKPLALQLQETEEKPEEDLQALPLTNIQRQETPEDEIQTKLTVGAPGDKYEQEADQMAAKVMAMPEPETPQLIQRQTGEEEEVQMKPLAQSITPLIQRQTAEGEESEEVQMLQRKGNGSFSASSNVESSLNGSKGGGSPLADNVRGFMESRFGADFSSVRVHTDSNAVQMNKELGAQAFTHGSDIYYGAGKSPGNNELTAHELTHTIQQNGAKKIQQSEVALKSHKDILQTKISSPLEPTIQRKQASKSPQADAGFQATKNRIHTEATKQKNHPPAKTKATEAQAAAVSPPNEKQSKAADKQVQEMNLQQPGKFDAAKFKAAVMEKIKAATPQTLEEADKFKDSNKLGSVKSDLSSQVSSEKKQAAGSIEDKTKEPPKTAGIPEKPVTPLPPSAPATPPGDVGAGQAVPKPKDGSEVSMQSGSQSLDQQMAEAKVSDEQLAHSNEPAFTEALGTKKQAQTDAKTSPANYRQQEQATLTQAQNQAQVQVKAPLQGMQGDNKQVLAKVMGQQGETKGHDEQKRSQVAERIQGIYNNTKQKVETSLSQLDAQVTQEFDRGASNAKSGFDAYVDGQMKRFKDARYSGLEGKALWVRDLFLPLPPEVNNFYQNGRKQYIDNMTVTIDKVANLVVTKLNAAKAEIANGKQEIQKYVASLDPSLRQVGQEAAQNIQGKFSELEQNVDNKQSELIDSLAQKYNENLQTLDADISKRKAENQGLVGKAKEAMTGVIQTILELKNMLMGMLAKASGAIEKIIKDPIKFLGNLVAGIKQGFMGFVGNISEHLKKGLIGWLTGSLASAGVQMPATFDLKGIFTMVMDLLGVTYNAMRGKIASKVGEKKVSALEKGFDMFVVWKNEGAAGLWKFIQDKLTNLKEMVLGGIQSFVVDTIITAGVTWVLSLLNPASAFVRACKLIVDVIMFFVERGSQIAALVNAVMDSVSAIADGAIGTAAKLVEGALSKALPVVIGFLASLIGLGGISGKIRGLIEKARGLIDTAVNWVLSKAIAFTKKLGGKLGLGKKGEVTERHGLDERTMEQKEADLNKAVSESDRIMEEKDATPDSVKTKLPAIKSKYKLTLLELVKDNETEFHVDAKINPEKLGGKHKLGKGGAFKLAPGDFHTHEGNILSSEDSDDKKVHLLTNHGQDTVTVFLKERLEKPLQAFLEVRQKRVAVYDEQIEQRKAAAEKMNGQMPKYKDTDPARYQKWLDGLQRNQDEIKNLQNKKAELLSIKKTDRKAIKNALEESEKDLKALNYKKSDITFQATKFYSNKIMEKAIMEALKYNQQKIDEGFTNKEGNSLKEGTKLEPPIEHQFSENLGIGYELNSKMEAVQMGRLRKVTVIVVLSDSKKRFYKVETAYPRA